MKTTQIESLLRGARSPALCSGTDLLTYTTLHRERAQHMINKHANTWHT